MAPITKWLCCRLCEFGSERIRRTQARKYNPSVHNDEPVPFNRPPEIEVHPNSLPPSHTNHCQPPHTNHCHSVPLVQITAAAPRDDGAAAAGSDLYGGGGAAAEHCGGQVRLLPYKSLPPSCAEEPSSLYGLEPAGYAGGADGEADRGELRARKVSSYTIHCHSPIQITATRGPVQIAATLAYNHCTHQLCVYYERSFSASSPSCVVITALSFV